MDFWSPLTWQSEEVGVGARNGRDSQVRACPHAQGTGPLKEAAHSVISGDKYALEASCIFPISFNLRVTWEHICTPKLHG